jgi:hypothetical protein
LVGISGNAAYLYGSGYSQAAPAKFKAKTKSMVLSYPNNKKRVLSGRFFLSDPSTIKRMVFRGSEGQLTWAEFQGGTELEFVIMVIAVSCVKLLSAHNSTQHTSRKHKV